MKFYANFIMNLKIIILLLSFNFYIWYYLLIKIIDGHYLLLFGNSYS